MIDVTYCYPWKRPALIDRRAVLKDLADTGITRLVLTEVVLSEMISDPGNIFSAKEELAAYGLKFVDAHAPWGLWKDIGMPLEKYHDQVVLRQKMAIRVCSECQVTSLTLHTGNTFNSVFGDLTLDDYYNMMIRSLEELLPDAEKFGVVLCLENIWTPLNQSACLLKAMEYFNSDFLGLCYDSGHARLTEFGITDPAKSNVRHLWENIGLPIVWENDIISKFQPWLVNCHLHDNFGMNDDHLLPGRGGIPNWDHIFDVISKAPRLQCVQSEVSVKDDITASLLRKTFQELSPLLNA